MLVAELCRPSKASNPAQRSSQRLYHDILLSEQVIDHKTQPACSHRDDDHETPQRRGGSLTGSPDPVLVGFHDLRTLGLAYLIIAFNDAICNS